MEITFENLPKAITLILYELTQLRELISQNKIEPIASEKEMLNVAEVANILRLHPTTVSQKLKNGLLPGQKKGKIWYIFANELTDYLMKSDLKSQKELNLEADNFLVKKKK